MQAIPGGSLARHEFQLSAYLTVAAPAPVPESNIYCTVLPPLFTGLQVALPFAVCAKSAMQKDNPDHGGVGGGALDKVAVTLQWCFLAERLQ